MGRRRNVLKGVSYGAVFLLLGLVTAFSFFIVMHDCINRHGVPTIEIRLKNTDLNEINEGGKEISYTDNELIVKNGVEEKDFTSIEISGRGNMTWGFEKKPYQIKFYNKEDLLGLGKMRKWNLLANYLDDSEVRTDLAFYISEIIGMKYTMKGEFVSLKIDDNDLGLYYIVTPLKINKQAVDLKEEGAILVEFDNAYCYEEEVFYVTKMKNCLVTKDVKNDDNIKEVSRDFGEQFEIFERAVYAGDYKTITSVIDVKSFAKYFLLNEFVANPDEFFTSFYMYKDGEGDLIHAGPVWDFDGAFGNINWWGEENEELYSPHKIMARREWVFSEDSGELGGTNADDNLGFSKLIYYLIEIPEFQELVRKTYIEELHGKDEVVINYIKERVNYIRSYAIKDNGMWGKNDFDESVEYLTWWVEQRFKAFDELFDVSVVFPDYMYISNEI